MKLIDGVYLKEIVASIHDYEASNKEFVFRYLGVGDLNLPSLEAVSLTRDQVYFKEISFILSVIASIVEKPLIAQADSDSVIRSDQAGHIDNDSFQEVTKDSALWKESNGEMKPEYVHFHEHTDELKTSENIFIGMLIKVIENDLISYNEFYLSILPKVGIDESMDASLVENLLLEVDKNLKKITFIKNSNFFKIIKKCDLSLKRVEPTNILLRNRLYNYCFRFYSRFIKYTDEKEAYEDLRQYYFYLLLKVLKKKEFVISKALIDKGFYRFTNSEFNLTFQVKDSPFISLLVEDAIGNKKSATHLLLFEEMNMDDIITYDLKTINFIGIWNLYDKDKNPEFIKHLKEEELIEKWLASKILVEEANKEVYAKYCPVCKSKDLELENDIYHCASCDSEYTYKEEEDIWFLKIKGN